MANQATLRRPIADSTDWDAARADPVKRLWVATVILERPKGTIVHFGPWWVNALTEQDALDTMGRRLEGEFPEGDGWVHTYDVLRVPRLALERGLEAYREEEAR